MDMPTKENLYLNTSSISIYTRMCSCVACRQWSAAGNMRESSFSKSAHHDWRCMSAKSSSCHRFSATQTNQTNTITIKDASFCNHLQNPIQYFFRLVASQYLLKQRRMTFQIRPGLRYNSVPHLQKLGTAVT